jgi:Subtilase family
MKRLLIFILILLGLFFVFFYFLLGTEPKIVGKVIDAPTETPLDSIIKNDSTYADYVFIKGVGYLRKDRKIVMLTGQDTAKSRQAEAIKSVEKDLENYWKWQILLGNKNIEDLSPKMQREEYSNNDEVSRKKNIFGRIFDVFKVSDAVTVVRDINKTCDCDDDLLLLSGQDLHLIETSLNPDGGLIILKGSQDDSTINAKIYPTTKPRRQNKENYSFLVGIIDSGINDEKKVDGNNPLNYNFVKLPVTDVKDLTQHGTKIARIIAHDSLNSNIGMVGLKAYDDKKIGNLYDNLCAIMYAIKHNMKVVNASWGTYQTKSIPVFEEVVRRAKSANMVIVCSAGNEGLDIDKDNFYPACYADNSELGSHIITVTSKNPKDKSPCQNSSSSGKKIDLTVDTDGNCKHEIPDAGGSVSPLNNEPGTSYAAPCVTASVANYIMANPGGFSKSGYISSIPANSKIKKYQ